MTTYTHNIPASEAVGLLEKLGFVVVDTIEDYTFVSMDYGYSWLRADENTTVVPLAEDGMVRYFSNETEAKASALEYERL